MWLLNQLEPKVNMYLPGDHSILNIYMGKEYL